METTKPTCENCGDSADHEIRSSVCYAALAKNKAAEERRLAEKQAVERERTEFAAKVHKLEVEIETALKAAGVQTYHYLPEGRSYRAESEFNLLSIDGDRRVVRIAIERKKSYSHRYSSTEVEIVLHSTRPWSDSYAKPNQTIRYASAEKAVAKAIKEASVRTEEYEDACRRDDRDQLHKKTEAEGRDELSRAGYTGDDLRELGIRRVKKAPSGDEIEWTVSIEKTFTVKDLEAVKVLIEKMRSL